MGLFNKKSGEKAPKLPELPKLPDLPSIENNNESSVPRLKMPESSQKLPSLPTFPQSSMGDSMSQNTIKEAVTGDEEEEYADEIEEIPKIQKPQKMQFASSGEEERMQEVREVVEKAEPIFIRLDKFEESIKTFEKVKEQIAEMGSLLEDIKKLKEEEEHELAYWEQELREIKGKIDKVDKDIFSMLE